MKRAAILIGSGTSKYGNLPGVDADLNRYSAFLQSPHGGAWNSGEIEILRSPSRELVTSTLFWRTMDADFSFVAFSGHGGHDMHAGTTIAVNDDDEISVSSLTSAAKRQLVVLDACRSVTSLDEGRTIKLGAVRKAAPSIQYVLSCRFLYDDAVLAAEEGRTVLYSCSVNQAAGESTRGGYFSRALVEHCADWAEAAPVYPAAAAEVLDVPTAFNTVSAFVTQQYYPQRPEMENGRRRRSFPLAVR